MAVQLHPACDSQVPCAPYVKQAVHVPEQSVLNVQPPPSQVVWSASNAEQACVGVPTLQLEVPLFQPHPNAVHIAWSAGIDTQVSGLPVHVVPQLHPACASHVTCAPYVGQVVHVPEHGAATGWANVSRTNRAGTNKINKVRFIFSNNYFHLYIAFCATCSWTFFVIFRNNKIVICLLG